MRINWLFLGLVGIIVLSGCLGEDVYYFDQSTSGASNLSALSPLYITDQNDIGISSVVTKLTQGTNITLSCTGSDSNDNCTINSTASTSSAVTSIYAGTGLDVNSNTGDILASLDSDINRQYVSQFDLNKETVSKIVAGTNITISPTSGIGEVTINSTASDSGIDTNTFTAGIQNKDNNSFNIDGNFNTHNIYGTNATLDNNLQTGGIVKFTTASGPLRFLQIDPTIKTITFDNIGAWSIYSPAGLTLRSLGTNALDIEGDVKPLGSTWNMGTSSSRWATGYFKNLSITGSDANFTVAQVTDIYGTNTTLTGNVTANDGNITTILQVQGGFLCTATKCYSIDDLNLFGGTTTAGVTGIFIAGNGFDKNATIGDVSLSLDTDFNSQYRSKFENQGAGTITDLNASTRSLFLGIYPMSYDSGTGVFSLETDFNSWYQSRNTTILNSMLPPDFNSQYNSRFVGWLYSQVPADFNSAFDIRYWVRAALTFPLVDENLAKSGDYNNWVGSRCVGDINSVWTSSNKCQNISGFGAAGAGTATTDSTLDTNTQAADSYQSKQHFWNADQNFDKADVNSLFADTLRVTSATSIRAVIIRADTPGNVLPLLVRASDSASEGLPTLLGSEVALFVRNQNKNYGAVLPIIGGTAGASSLLFGDANVVGIGRIIYSHITDSMVFQTNNSPAIFISSTQDVQLNNDLNVAGDMNVVGTLRVISDVNVISNLNVTKDINAAGIVDSIILYPQQAKIGHLSGNPMLIDGGQNRFFGLFADGANADWTMPIPRTWSTTLSKRLIINWGMQSVTSGTQDWNVSVDCVSPGDSQDMNAFSFDTNNSVSGGTVPATVGYMKNTIIPLTSDDSMAPLDLCTIRVFDGGGSATGYAKVPSLVLEVYK